MTKKIVEKLVVMPNIKCNNSSDVLKILGKKLVKEGFVQAEYIPALIEREQTYPTGLPSDAPRIAIPHADYTLVNKTAVAIAILEDPVIFYNMEQVDQPLEIKIVILLAVAEPHAQIEMLQKVIAIIQNRELSEELSKCKTEQEILQLLEPVFMN